MLIDEAGGMTRPRTISDSRENHRKSFQIPEQSRPDFARSLDNNNKSDPAGIHHSSPFRPNDPSHLFGSSPNIPIKSSPTSGTSPSQYTGGLYGYPPMPPAPGSSYDSRTTPVGSYSHSTPPFAYQQYMVSINSNTSNYLSSHY